VCLIAVPLVGAAVAAALGPRRDDAVRWVSLGATLLAFVLSVVVAWDFAARRLEHPGGAVERLRPGDAPKVALLPLGKGGDPEPASIHFYVGLDGLNVWLVVLTTLLMVCSVLSSWKAVTERVNEYYAWMLMLQMAMVGVFLSFDIILFYVFFELTL